MQRVQGLNAKNAKTLLILGSEASNRDVFFVTFAFSFAYFA
jgi:hypothetical protein